MISSGESLCSSCCFPGIVVGSRWKGKLNANLLSLPCTHQTRVSSQTPIKTIVTDQRLFVDEARDASFALTGYLGLLFTFQKFLWELSFLVSYKFNSFPHTSKYKNQGMFIIRGAMLTVCPTKKYRTKVNDLLTQSKLGPSAGRAVASVLRLQKSTRRAARPPGTQLAAVSWRVSGCGFNGQSLPGTLGLERRHTVMLPQILSPPSPSSHSVSALFSLKIQGTLRVTH